VGTMFARGPRPSRRPAGGDWPTAAGHS
jgi:hypothetical protein